MNDTPTDFSHHETPVNLPANRAEPQYVSDVMAELVLAGGIEAMSRAPLLLHDNMVHWLADWWGAKTFTARLKVLECLAMKSMEWTYEPSVKSHKKLSHKSRKSHKKSSRK